MSPHLCSVMCVQQAQVEWQGMHQCFIRRKHAIVNQQTIYTSSSRMTHSRKQPFEQAVNSILDLLRQKAELLSLWRAVHSEALCSSLSWRCAGRRRRSQLEDCLKGHFSLVRICIGAEV